MCSLSNTPHPPDFQMVLQNADTAEEAFACSDASDDAAAGVELDIEHMTILGHWRDDKSKVLEEHIFVNEVLAAVRTAKWVAGNHEACSLRITILVDNIPARRALERGYSTNNAIAKIVFRMWLWADQEGIDLKFRDVDTKYNVADCLTRDWTKHKDGPNHNRHQIGCFCRQRLTASSEILAGTRPGRPDAVSDQSRWSKVRKLDVPEELEYVVDDDLKKFLDLVDSSDLEASGHAAF